MSDNIERAAEVIHNVLHPINECHPDDALLAIDALAAEGLLLTAEQERLIALGEAVEAINGRRTSIGAGRTPMLRAIYAEAERSRGATT